MKDSHSKKQLAADFFHGEQGYNCAQAVLKAYQNESGMSELTIRSAKVIGGGRAKEGTCGALYAAHILLGENNQSKQVTQQFLQTTGSTLCSDIKQSECGCRGYVAKVAELTTEHIQHINGNNAEYANSREIRERTMIPCQSCV
ncbi:C-GCAxxG-C-C family protein [Vibrio sp. TH_r3]|uniref:C-GCAxxG-C-C family protein n=1 Tax=Vibrio sp. TH_r3 TaxID=3082084 RepID=UPI002954C224|nr:C-GCAxxG-C-C family protein [Vibrio sp. TH_r3]MDV7104726.1 C-GCAxxG-C-C family protein [Vibrio sp. TH_r3]